MNIAIIGSAGRGEDGPKITRTVYTRAYEWLLSELADVPVLERHLRSGGAAAMDHLAVELYLAGAAASLTLILPCEWEPTKLQFADTGERDWRTNPGGTSNHYHREFSRRLQRSPWAESLAQIQQAINRGAVVHVVPGFHNRNVPVGHVDRLYALTFGHFSPKDGGTKHTWDHSPAPFKRHVGLHLFGGP